jgi:ketosteroid isomerase-like protein
VKLSLIILATAMIGCQRAPTVSGDGGISRQPDSAMAGNVANRNSNLSDLASIGRLHQQDVAATLSRNPRALAELWTKDAVRMEPGGPAEVGKQTIYINDSTHHARSPQTQIIRYAPSITDVQIVGDWAIEWGHFDGAYKQSPSDSVHAIRGNLLRVLRRQADGSWRFARVMWNEAE